MASKPKINKMITKVNFSDSNRSAGQIKYLVKHFVVIKLTKAGVDLAEGTIEDAGVDI